MDLRWHGTHRVVCSDCWVQDGDGITRVTETIRAPSRVPLHAVPFPRTCSRRRSDVASAPDISRRKAPPASVVLATNRADQHALIHAVQS